MGKSTLISCGAATVVMLMLLSLPGLSQQDVTQVDDTAFTTKMRPPVSFLHDQHNEKAKIDQCNVCHHVYEHGTKSESTSSEGTKCSECHKMPAGDPMPLIAAYHNLCKGCHMKTKTGPVMCAECHAKEMKKP